MSSRIGPRTLGFLGVAALLLVLGAVMSVRSQASVAAVAVSAPLSINGAAEADYAARRVAAMRESSAAGHAAMLERSNAVAAAQGAATAKYYAHGDLMLAKPAFGNGSVTGEIAPLGMRDAGHATPSAAHTKSGPPTVTRLVSGLQGGSGSTIGPDGALYVAETAAGKISRVDPKTGAVTEFARGLPISMIGLGGVMDIAFVDQNAYALVTLVSTDGGGSHVDGIYQITGPDSFTVIADIGKFSVDNPPSTPFDVPTGVQYAMQPYRGGFLVTDGHHNRVLQVGLVDCGTELDDCVTQLIQFGNIVPTGLAVRGNTVYMAEAGPVPHLPQNGKIEAIKSMPPVAAPIATLVASGAPLLVDVEFGLGRTLYGLAQGTFSPENGPGSPADPNTGELVEVNGDGTFTVITGGLNQPTSLEFIGNTAYVVTLAGEIWKIDNVSPPPHGK